MKTNFITASTRLLHYYKSRLLQVVYIFLVTVSLQAYGQEIEWDKVYGGSKDDLLTSIHKTSDGGYILGGVSSSGISGDKTEDHKGCDTYYCPGTDFWIVKISASGEKMWDRTYGGSKDDELTVVLQTSDGGYIVGGSSASPISGDKTEANKGACYSYACTSDYWIVKLDADGNKLWDRTIGSSSDDHLTSMEQTSDGGYILGGYSYSDIGGDKSEAPKGGCVVGNCPPDYWVVKINSTGDVVWDKTLGGDNADLLTSVKQTIDGGYIVGGYSNSSASGDKSETFVGICSEDTGYCPPDYWVIKLDAEGDKQWDRTVGGSERDYLVSVAQTSDGGYILGGSSGSSISGDKTEASKGVCRYNDSLSEVVCTPDYWIVKLSAAGKIEWDRTIGGSEGDGFTSLLLTSDGGYLLGGSSGSPISGDKTEVKNGSCFYDDYGDYFCTSDYWIVKVDAFGYKEWDRTFGGSDYDDLNALEHTSDGGYLLGGYSGSNISKDKTEPSKGAADFWVIKLKGTRSCTPPDVSITLKPASGAYTGGDASHLYLGYGPQSVTLQASGADSYTWSPASGLSSTTAANPVFTPTSVGTYTFTVTGSNGACTATASVTITVTDVRCGNKNDKVMVCHNGQSICMSASAVQAHLRNHPQDKLGGCGAEAMAKAKDSGATIKAYPNPFSSQTTIAFTFEQQTEYTLQVFDLSGNLVQQWPKAKAVAGREVRVDWEPKRSKKGVYILRLVSQQGVQNFRLMRE